MLSKDLYQACTKLKLPKYLQDQIDRASSSVCLNLAEGYGKRTYVDQRKFFQIAMGSLRETQSVLLISNLDCSSSYKIADVLGAHLYRLIKAMPR
jgi:four helix bundle protein